MKLIRTRTRRATALVASTAASVLVLSGVAFADTVKNDVVNDADSRTITAGNANGTDVTYFVDATSSGGFSGCDATPTSPMTLTINAPIGVTATPGSLEFTSCGSISSGGVVTNGKTVKFTSNTPSTGTGYAITSTAVDNVGNYGTNNADFTLTVNAATPPPPPANTEPTVVVAGVTGGASYSKGSVPAATCNVSDAQDGPSSFPATLSAITGPYASDGIGSQTASCSYTDRGTPGLTDTDSSTYSIVDPSPPVITAALNPSAPDGDNHWYKGNVTLTWNVSDSQSPNSLQTTTGCVNQNITADQAAITYPCSATSAGGSTTHAGVSIKRDGTAPAIGSALGSVPLGSVPTKNAANWYNEAVTVSFTCTDGLSGIATCTPNSVLGEGVDQSVTGTARDNAGNSASTTVSDIDIDLTDPTTPTFNAGGPAAGSSHFFGSVPAKPDCSSTDALSGLKSCVVTGYSTAVGTHTMTATATDNADNTSTATSSYTVDPWTLKGFYSPVDMSGVWNTVKGGATVPLKFEIFAGLTELNNISVVDTFIIKGVACPVGGYVADDIELVTTGSTSLRYDSTGGQFIQNWQTPKRPGSCYSVTMTTNDGSSISANFQLK